MVPIHHDGLGMQQSEALVERIGAHARRLGKKLRHLGHGVFRRQRQVRDQDVHRFSTLVLEHLFQRGLRPLFATGGGRIQRIEAAFELAEEAVVDVEKQCHQIDGFGGALGGIRHRGKHCCSVNQVGDAVVVKERDRGAYGGIQRGVGDEPALNVVAVDGEGAVAFCLADAQHIVFAENGIEVERTNGQAGDARPPFIEDASVDADVGHRFRQVVEPYAAQSNVATSHYAKRARYRCGQLRSRDEQDVRVC